MGLLSVIADSREPSWVQQLTFGGASVAVAMLDAGDLLCATDDGRVLVLERKSASDFLNTLRDERLFPQVAKLRDCSEWAYLVICGTLHSGPGNKVITDERETGWNWSSIDGALRRVQEAGVIVSFVASDFDFEARVLQIANEPPGPIRVAPARDVTIIGEQEQVLAALPGIGTERAAALLKQFTPAMAIAWLTTPGELWDPPKVVAGIGEGTRRRVRRALGLDDRLSLDVVIHERSNGK